jgi:hypothetical protein
VITFNSLHKEFYGYIGEKPTKELHKFMIIDDKVYEIHNVRVHEFKLSDAEDPDLYAAMPMIEWQETEKGKWVMEHAIESPIWHRNIEPQTFGWRYTITARLKGPDYTFFTLKWGQNN